MTEFSEKALMERAKGVLEKFGTALATSDGNVWPPAFKGLARAHAKKYKRTLHVLTQPKPQPKPEPKK